MYEYPTVQAQLLVRLAEAEHELQSADWIILDNRSEFDPVEATELRRIITVCRQQAQVLMELCAERPVQSSGAEAFTSSSCQR